MWKIMIPMLILFGFCAAVAINPPEFWIDAPPDYVLAGCSLLFFMIVLAYWICAVVSNARDESGVALTAFINNSLTEVQRQELTEPDPNHELNSGYRRWKTGVRRHALAFLIRPPLYADL